MTADPRPAVAVTTAVVGVDVGGTKTHVAVVAPDGARRDAVVASDTWRRGSLFSGLDNFDRLVAVVDQVQPGASGGRLVFGLHGVDTPAQRDVANAELARHAGGTVHVVNDAQLLGPASGRGHCIAAIVGTGAAVVGTDATGTTVSADGYGALLADVGSAPGLVREVVRAALRTADWDGPAVALADPVVSALCRVYGAVTVQDLALAVSEERPISWGRHAPLVFEAAEEGSATAARVLHDAADVIARNAAAVRRRGALGDAVVAAGGVITKQPMLQELVRARLAEHAPGLAFEVLSVAPVEGALALAGRL